MGTHSDGYVQRYNQPMGMMAHSNNIADNMTMDHGMGQQSQTAYEQQGGMAMPQIGGGRMQQNMMAQGGMQGGMMGRDGMMRQGGMQGGMGQGGTTVLPRATH